MNTIYRNIFLSLYKFNLALVCLILSNLYVSVKCQLLREKIIIKSDSILINQYAIYDSIVGCKKINWFDWQKISAYKYEGTSIIGDKATLNADPSSLLQGMFNLELNDNTFQPKIVPQMPTPFMPGNSTKVLTHRISLDQVTNIDSLYFFIASVPNSNNGFQGPQVLKIHLYDKSNVLLDISNLNLLFRDPSIFGLSRTDVNFTPFELQLTVSNNGSLADGDALIFNRFPKNVYYIEIEHNDNKSFTWDGVFINLGLPVCCTPFSLISKDTTICEGSSIKLESPVDSTVWSNGFHGKEIVVNSAGWYWAETKNNCGTFRDSILVSYKLCTGNCTFACDHIEWIDWTQNTKNKLNGSSKKYGNIELNLDPNYGTQHPLLNNVNLLNSIYFPKNLTRVPTPWMPGNFSTTKLIHKLNVGNIVSKKDLLLLLGEFPNSSLYSMSQIGKLRIYNRNAIQLNTSDICLLLSDDLNFLSPVQITNTGFEIQFLVKDLMISDGGLFVLTNFPDSTFTIEIEHNNERSSRDDGIYLTVGFPDCCTVDSTKIDSIVCSFIDFDGKRIASSGTYYSTIKTTNCDSVVVLNVNIVQPRTFKLPNDTVICSGNTLTLISDSDSTNWNDNSKGKSFLITNSGKYWASFSDVCGTYSDTINVLFISKPAINLGPDKTICPNQVDTIWSNDSNTIWQDGSIGKYFIIKKSGFYYGSITNNCGTSIDSIKVDIFPNSSMNLGPDKILCEGLTDTLKSNSDSTIWNDKSIGRNLFVSKTGKYWGSYRTFCGIESDTIDVLFESPPKISLGQDRLICPNQKDTIWSSISNTIWQDGSIGNYYIANKDGFYIGSVSNNCGIARDTIQLKYYSKIVFDLGPDKLLCKGDIDTLWSTSDSTIWFDGAMSKYKLVNRAGKYWGTIVSPCEILSDTIVIASDSIPKIQLGLDKLICPNQMDTIRSMNTNSIWQDGSKGEYFIADKAGIYFATISSICGSASDTIEFKYFPKSNIDLGPDRIICDGIQYTLSSESDSTLWFDGTYSKFKTISKSGIYWGTVISKCGNVSDSLNLTVIPIISVKPLVKDTILCDGVNFNLNILGISELWNNFYLDSIRVDHPGVYRYSYFDICNNLLDSISVIYDSIPLPLKQRDITLCDYEELVLSTHNSNTIWSNGTVGSDIKINKAGSYFYLIENACGLFKDTIDVNVIEDQSTFIPNVFSPNGDNINDEFPGTQFTSDFNLKIYNRWGGLVFEAENQHWKGKFKDLDVSPGVYAYIIQSKYCNGKLKYGSVTLVR